ncbi:hypothetical protein O6H91_07G002100 [Diphasiastrum complanatum]|uniref:Uncharacterized protein n=1 Tax=Diphasiastrum complanatum TaxID=34168 RepID=A0ACC2D1S9_DIPCM|nr:hypothetical protein O6H91_07G002100 [Diphasiastrum complanatum]
MGRQPCCEKIGLKKGPWTAEEDLKLVNFINRHGHCCWRAVPKLAGLLRCGKSCRLRWTNYLRPDLKRGYLTDAEEMLIIDLHAVMGNRWSRIAAQLPGRTDNEIKNYWNTRIRKRLRQMGIDPSTHQLVVPAEARSAANLEDLESTADAIAPNSVLASTESNITKEQPDSVVLACKRAAQEVNIGSSILNLLSLPRESLAQTQSRKKDLCAFEVKETKGFVANRNVVSPCSPTSVISRGMTDEECEDSSSTKSEGRSGSQALVNDIKSRNWTSSSLQQPSNPEIQGCAFPVHSPFASAVAFDAVEFLPCNRISTSQTTIQEMALSNIAENIAEADMVPCITTGSCLDPSIVDYLNWINMPVAWASEEGISLPNYAWGTPGGDSGESSSVLSPHLSDGYGSWAEADMASPTCQEIQRLAAILDDL